MRLIYTFVFVLTTSIVFSQKSTLFQNINPRAKELKHNLNKSGDSLIFKCERTIFEVVIFNKDFERIIKVRGIEGVIPIADVPVGKYIVEVLLSDKLIVMTLLRNESINVPDSISMITDNTDLFEKKLATQKVVSKSKPEESVGKEKNTKKTNLAVAGKKAKPIRREVKKGKPKPEIKRVRTKKVISRYWIVYKINKGTSTEKIQKIANQDEVNRMIRKIEIDMKTKTGRLNELIAWTIYDSSEFIIHKRKNKEDYMNTVSESFNIEPYFKKVNEPDNL